MEFNGTFVVAFISFIIFIFIMNWILYKPIGDIVEKRKKLINDNYDEAKENTYKSAIILQERVDQLNDTRVQNRDKYVQELNVAKERKVNAIHSAKEKSLNNIEDKTNLYEEESKRAREVLKKDVVQLARMISGKFVELTEDDEIDNELINKVIQG